MTRDDIVPAPPYTPVAVLARELGKSSQCLRNWCRQHGIGHLLAGRWVVPDAIAADLRRGVRVQEVSNRVPDA